MINPIVIIITISLILSVLVICVINRPKKPIITGTLLFILIGYVVITFLVDAAITGNGEVYSGFIGFLAMSNSPTYGELADTFKALMTADITLMIVALLSLFTEIMLILRKGSDK